MTAADLITTFRARGVELMPVGERLRVRPAEGLTKTELDALRAHKAEVLRLLTGEAPVPTGPCGLCSAPLAWVEDWPFAGESRWLCMCCAAWPSPSLAEVFGTLTREEREQLRAEAAGGDRLAVEVSKQLGVKETAGRKERP
jgi:hypothetical protein